MKNLIDRDELIGFIESLTESTTLTGIKKIIYEMPLEIPQEDNTTEVKLDDLCNFVFNVENVATDISSDFNKGFDHAKNRVIFELRKKFTKVTAQDLPDRRCGTCVNYVVAPNFCDLGWKCVKSEARLARDMYETDGASCRDWQSKPKEKVRVWTCLNCSKDIYFDIHASEKHQRYYHLANSNVRCNSSIPMDSGNLATPKPDSERWIET